MKIKVITTVGQEDNLPDEIHDRVAQEVAEEIAKRKNIEIKHYVKAETYTLSKSSYPIVYIVEDDDKYFGGTFYYINVSNDDSDLIAVLEKYIKNIYTQGDGDAQCERIETPWVNYGADLFEIYEFDDDKYYLDQTFDYCGYETTKVSLKKYLNVKYLLSLTEEEAREYLSSFDIAIK